MRSDHTGCTARSHLRTVSANPLETSRLCLGGSKSLIDPGDLSGGFPTGLSRTPNSQSCIIKSIGVGIEWHLVKESDGTLKGSSRRAQGGRAREARSGTLGYECENR